MAVEAYAGRRARSRARAVAFGVRVVVDLLATGVRARMRSERDEERGGSMGARDLWMDVRVAGRSLGRAPGFAAAAVLVLALGIGVNTAVFSALRATLLEPPPFADHERIVVLDLTDSSTVHAGPPRAFPWSYPKFRAFQEDRSLPLETSAAYARRPFTLTGAGDALYLFGEAVTPSYLGILGVVPVVGRDFRPEDDEEGAGMMALLAHALWVERFGGDRGVVGRDVVLNGRPVTVIGVAPPGFRGLTGQASLWLPVRTGAALTAPFLVSGAQAHWLRAVGRLSPGASVEALDERMRAAGRVVEEAYPDTDPTVVRGGSARALAEARVHPQARTSLLVLAAGGLLLLLVACANLAGLLVARANGRLRDAAVRVALGAGRWRVTRTFLVEALLLAGAGGLAGLLVAAAGVDALAALWPARFVDASWGMKAAAVDAVGIDAAVLAFATAVAVASGLLAGVAPALSIGRVEPAERLRGGPGARRPARVELRGGLVTVEIALALVLLVGAGLLIRSLDALQQVERGFQAEGLVAFEYALPRGSRAPEDAAAFHERYLERLRALPGVEAAALACAPPLAGHCMITRVRRAGDRAWDEGARPDIGVQYVSDDFFRTLDIPVLRGRTFTSEDQRGSRPVVVLSRAAADELFPEGDALGRTLEMGTGLTPEGGAGAAVVGVVEDVLFDRPTDGIMAEAFVSHRQEEGGSTVLLRAGGDPLSVIPGARAALGELDPDIPLFSVRTLEDLEAAASADTRVVGTLLSAFALLALLLACTGVWAIVSYTVARRTREIGVRVALGAGSTTIVRGVLRRGLLPALAGVALGGVGAWIASALLRSLLFGIGPSDPVSFAGAAVLLLAVSAVAAWLPARRAASVDPMTALRAE